MADSINENDDVIDVRDVIARVEELRGEQDDFEHDDDGNRTAAEWSSAEPDDAIELATLESLLADMRGFGGDHQWEGDWYPVTLINESHFTEYCEELVKDIGALPSEIPSYLVIDWEATADNLRVDYSQVEFRGETFLYR